MKNTLKFGIFMAMMVFAVTGCNKEDDPTDDLDNPNTVMKAAAVSGTVLDADGNPLGGVSVSTGTQNVTTGNDGAFSFEEAGVVNDRAVIHFEKSGYFTLTRSAAIDDDGEISLQTMMPRKGTNAGLSLQTDFNAGSDKTLQIGEMTLVFPAGSVMNANGSAYGGKVRADVLYVANDNKNAGRLIPDGNLSGKNAGKILQTYGMTDVVLSDASGKPLKIKENGGVEISFPAPDYLTDASLPLWSFSEETGVWTENGVLSRQGNAYKGAVKHFSPEALGLVQEKAVVIAQILVCDKPQAGVPVNLAEFIDAFDDDYYPPVLVASGMTNSQGNCRMQIAKNCRFAVSAAYNGKTQSQTVPASDYGQHIVYLRFNEGCYGTGAPNIVVRGRLNGQWSEQWNNQWGSGTVNANIDASLSVHFSYIDYLSYKDKKNYIEIRGTMIDIPEGRYYDNDFLPFFNSYSYKKRLPGECSATRSGVDIPGGYSFNESGVTNEINVSFQITCNARGYGLEFLSEFWGRNEYFLKGTRTSSLGTGADSAYIRFPNTGDMDKAYMVPDGFWGYDEDGEDDNDGIYDVKKYGAAIENFMKEPKNGLTIPISFTHHSINSNVLTFSGVITVGN